MGEHTDIKKIASILLSSGKVRIDGDRLETILEEDRLAGNLLILISDIDHFIESIEMSPSFSEMRIVISEVGFEEADVPDDDLIVIFKDELPGPVARLSVDQSKLTELVSWESVEQIEEITTYNLFE